MEHKDAQRAARARPATPEQFIALVRHGTQRPDLDPVITEGAVRLLGADYAALTLLDETGMAGFYGVWGHQTNDWMGVRFRLGEGTIGRALLSQQTVVLDYLSDTPLSLITDLPLGTVEGGRAVLIIPLLSQGVLLGGMLLGWRREVVLLPSHIDQLESLASYAAAMLVSAAAHVHQPLQEEATTDNRRLDAVLEEISDAFIVLDARQQVRYINLAGERLSGHSRATLLGRHMSIVFPPTVGSALGDTLNQALETRKPVTLESDTIVDGRHLELHAYPTDDGLVLYCQDVTARYEAEHERTLLLERERAAQARAEAALRIRDDFLVAAAHHLRTPLTGVMGYTDLLQRRLDRGDSFHSQWLRPQLEALRTAGTRLMTVVEGLSDVAHLQIDRTHENYTSVVDLAALVQVVMQRTQRLADHLAVPVTATLPPRALLIRADRARLERAIKAIVDNAVKFSTHRTPVAVTLDVQTLRGVTIAVRDRGIGIPADELAQIGTPFYRASNARALPGTGLGLASTRAIVEQYGGHLTIESSEQGGTTVYVSFPPEVLVRRENVSA